VSRSESASDGFGERSGPGYRYFGGDERIAAVVAENAALWARVAELERREALLTDVVNSRDFVDALDNMPAIQYIKLNPATTANTRLAAIVARQALADAGFPWTEGES
jgi:hypothetical protein